MDTPFADGGAALVYELAGLPSPSWTLRARRDATAAGQGIGTAVALGEKNVSQGTGLDLFAIGSPGTSGGGAVELSAHRAAVVLKVDPWGQTTCPLSNAAR